MATCCCSATARAGLRCRCRSWPGRESAERDDRDFPFGRFAIRPTGLLPGGAGFRELRGGTWLPFGADTVLFAPRPVQPRHKAAFLGSLYPKRVEFLGRLGIPLDRMAPAGGNPGALPPRARGTAGDRRRWPGRGWCAPTACGRGWSG